VLEVSLELVMLELGAFLRCQSDKLKPGLDLVLEVSLELGASVPYSTRDEPCDPSPGKLKESRAA
jgi:hypothetical protein